MKHWVWIAAAVVLLSWIGQSEWPFQSPAKTVSGLSSQAHQSSDKAAYIFVTGNRVNQRTGPGTGYQVVGQLDRGSRVRVVEQSDKWTRISSQLGNGWMSSRYLSAQARQVNDTEGRLPTRRIATPTDREIQAARNMIIQQSIASYPGSCPCPYNRDRAGRRCGGRSAWSRPGGYSPICYDSDVSTSRLNSYFARLRGASN